jgi:hypothetical protein
VVTTTGSQGFAPRALEGRWTKLRRPAGAEVLGMSSSGGLHHRLQSTAPIGAVGPTFPQRSHLVNQGDHERMRHRMQFREFGPSGPLSE